jgi:hypothetical protein
MQLYKVKFKSVIRFPTAYTVVFFWSETPEILEPELQKIVIHTAGTKKCSHIFGFTIRVALPRFSGRIKYFNFFKLNGKIETVRFLNLKYLNFARKKNYKEQPEKLWMSECSSILLSTTNAKNKCKQGHIRFKNIC